MSALRPSCFSCRSLPCKVCPLYWSRGELRLTLPPAGDLVGNKEALLSQRGLPLFLLKKMQRGELSGEGARAATLCSHLPDKRRQTFCVRVCWGLAVGFGWLLERRFAVILSSPSAVTRWHKGEAMSWYMSANNTKEFTPRRRATRPLFNAVRRPSGPREVNRSLVKAEKFKRSIQINSGWFGRHWFSFCFAFLFWEWE